ncbi:MAG: FAD-dependent oxidoreductase [Burkholderiales bacterium]|uniref:NAD(P)/FAD-dependent oxidoreductase n=1 Tax=Nitrosomonas sp. TaxID=42353 RepID=UPI001D8836CA|nr:FAD-dependent oxidoreductase [Nitrosomonas sp.]MCB1949444.1 FAD-dependent oxidoreductase [Nitrosomonas sp.]MCP5243172.1 FAD-dependent oxidoreductase [Burkholderiales bacterium]
MTQPVIIIGSGLAGYAVARELRRLTADQPMVLISADHSGFYSKPMLSNALSTGKTPESIINSDAEKMAAQLKIDIRPHTRVTAIHNANKTVLLSNNERLEYSTLVLAVGADQVKLTLQGNAMSEILTVNDVDDYKRFRDALAVKKRIVIIGAGLIGCEFANDLSATGYQVDVIDIASQPLGRLLPSEAGAYLQKKLEDVGVVFHLSASVQSVDRIDERLLLTLANGEKIETEIVLSSVGLTPRINLAQEAGLHVNRGIVVNQLLQTSDENIYALGDCAEVVGKILPFVMPITHAARALAATLAGNPTPVFYPAMPVLVKTPACPTVVAPPEAGRAGEWQVESDADGVTAVFLDDGGNLLGFALLGQAIAQKNDLAAKLPPVLG